MSETTKIQWADATFNPWIGCTKVSPGCANCYAENTTRARVLRSQGHETWGKGKPRSRTSAATWKQPLKWNRLDGNNPDGFRRLRVFPSLCDWLDDEVPIEWLADFLKLIFETKNLDWLLLTKRPENFFPLIQTVWRRIIGTNESLGLSLANWENGVEVPQNVWIGTSCEDQKRADERIPELLKIPAKIRFLSCEPLLGPIQFRTPADFILPDHSGEVGIHWVIVGGESGSCARPCDVEWIRAIVKQSSASGATPFVKQFGSRPYSNADHIDHKGDRRDKPNGFYRFLNDKKGGDMSEWPEDLRFRKFPEVTL